MRLEKMKKRRVNVHCHNGCVRKNGVSGRPLRVTATHVMWLLARPTYLCSSCANSMEDAWFAAKENWAGEWMEVAA